MESGGDVHYDRNGWNIKDSYGQSSPVVEYVGSYHVVVSGIVGGSSLVSRDSYGKDNYPSTDYMSDIYSYYMAQIIGYDGNGDKKGVSGSYGK